MHGATRERVCWYPLAHRLHFFPVTPSLHGHWPVVGSHIFPAAPTGWHPQATQRRYGLLLAQEIKHAKKKRRKKKHATNITQAN